MRNRSQQQSQKAVYILKKFLFGFFTLKGFAVETFMYKKVLLYHCTEIATYVFLSKFLGAFFII